MNRFVFTGKHGMLARSFLSSYLFSNSMAFSHSQFDITDIKSKILDNIDFDYLINCAAYTDVTSAQSNKTVAYNVNVNGVKNLVEICNRKKATLVHFSTDYVFDGMKSEYFENDSLNPVNYYGETKAFGEKYIIKNSNNFIILRVSWLYGESGRNFFTSIYEWVQKKDKLKIVADQFGRTTFCNDTVKATYKLIQAKLSGIYHFCNQGVVSRFEYARHIRDTLKTNCNIYPVQASEFPDPVPRPKQTILNTRKIEKDIIWNIPNWKDSVNRYVNLYLKNK